MPLPGALPLQSLSTATLVELGAQLESELAEIEVWLKVLEAELTTQKHNLLAPGTRLAVNVAAILIGIVAAPFTVGISLVCTATGAAMTAWDALDFRRDAARVLTMRAEVGVARGDIQLIHDQLDDILSVIEQRYPRLP